MTVKNIVAEQYKAIVDKASANLAQSSLPKEGWIKTMRNALGMSVINIAKNMGVTRASIYQSERLENSGGITLRQMEQIAGAMKCKFVYAIVPHNQFSSVQDMINDQAKKKAIEVVKKASVHMALEAQDLSLEQREFEVKRIMNEILKDMPSDFWNE